MVSSLNYTSGTTRLICGGVFISDTNVGGNLIFAVVRFELLLYYRVLDLEQKHFNKMPKCPNCNKEVYFAEKVQSLGKDWHRPCLKCKKCSKTLSSGQHAEHDGKPYCHKPCYSALFGPGGFGRGGTESHKY